MKTLPLFAALVTFLSIAVSAHAERAEGTDAQTGESVCAARVIRAYMPVVDQPDLYDKYKHCAMSCVVALHCGSAEAWAAGLGKEIKDALTHVFPSRHRGDPSIKDLDADGVGIKFVTRGYVKSAQDCYAGCHKFFPMPADGPGI